jgi:Kdo2-lipid IVA lauroyltransferase/acyltransferase
MKRWIGWFGRACSWLLYIAPAFVRRAIGSALAFLWFDVLRIRRDVALGNLRIAFPDWDERMRVRVARHSIHNLGWNLTEYCYFPFLTRENLGQTFEFEGLEIYERAAAKGKGVLLLTLHLGNGDLGCAGLALKGIPMVLVSKFFTFKWLNDLWFGMRARAGIRFIPPRNSSYTILKALKKGAAVAIPLDQFTGPPIGVRTTFFGRETGTGAGLAVMAERSGAAVVSVYTVRLANGRHLIRFSRELGNSGDVEALTQSYNDELESLVRAHPEQWMWIHKRWKRFVVK